MLRVRGRWERTYDLPAGRVLELGVGLEQPAALPDNGRLAVEWVAAPGPREGAAGATATAHVGAQGEAKPADPDTAPRMPDAFGIDPQATAGWRKVLHALDSDVYLIYRVPVAGRYTLRLGPVTDEAPLGEGARFREKGSAPELFPLPRQTPWPSETAAAVRVLVRPVPLGDAAEEERLRATVEFEPNDTPEQAQTLTLAPGDGDEVRTWEITGGADDLEHFDNGKVSRAGDDWLRVEYTGTDPRLLTAQLSMPGQALLARVRCYRSGAADGESNPTEPGQLVPLAVYEEGRDGNERVHQQDEEHRANITRLLKPKGTYFLRVEANAPGYQLQLRLLPPAPYEDPRLAIRQGMYTQIGQVDAWLTNRPRGASVERRIREAGNLLGTQCMSCHTQSGVWGPAAPLARGYRLENAQNYWHLLNVMYECLRPTNTLKEAANNTSLAPLDLGDGPAGTRVAGFNIVHAERVVPPRRLHAMQQLRTANFVLQTRDPSGINAAGPGSNHGQVVVHLFAAEILRRAWETTGEPKYFRALEARARRVLAVAPKFTDDVALRLDFFGRVLPLAEYPAWAARAAEAEEGRVGEESETDAQAGDEPGRLVERAKARLAEDEARLRAVQKEDGSWGFSPGSPGEGGRGWKPAADASDPAPTALGIWGLTSVGHGKDEPAVAKALKALLKMQEPSGRWNKAAQTGFVTSAYALHALARLYPEAPEPAPGRASFAAKPGESLLATIRRVQAVALRADPALAELLLPAARHEGALVRYWAMIGLGATHGEAGVAPLIAGLGDRAKLVREAAAWGLRQTLLDDRGWEAAFAAYEHGDDRTREALLQALAMRADAVLSRASLDWKRLGDLFDRAMNRDPHPGVRAWAAKAAWQWWVWNPPVRPALNDAWLRMLEREETNLLVENSNRYSTQALFIANGHKANGSKEHQYPELEQHFAAIAARLETPPDAETGRRLGRRLVGVAATFYATSGGDGGPGQMGYVTPGAGEMMARAVMAYLREATGSADMRAIRTGLEGAANVPDRALAAWLVDYSLKGPEELRQLAAGSVSDPRSVMLAAVPELVEPQIAQVRRGAMEPARRPQISDPILDLWMRVNWVVPKTEEQQKAFFDLMIPRFARFLSPEEVAKEPDASKRAEIEREMDAAWYLADRMGEVLEKNPDLHQEIVFRRYFPASFKNPLEGHFWLRNVEWLLNFKPPSTGSSIVNRQSPIENAVPETQSSKSMIQNPDEALTIKDRALQLYLDQLKPGSNAKSRAVAIRMANKTALRKNPEVLRALADLLPHEKDESLRRVIENALKQGTEKFMPELLAELKAEQHASTRTGAGGEPELTKEQSEDLIYFRDYVMPELARPKRSDQMACLGCHGVPGRVPSLTLKPTDEFGYISVADLLVNYRELQQRVDLNDLDRSKLLRKPLNVQDGTEDGHQGGRRYSPTDEGYLILKKWVENQPKVQLPGARAGPGVNATDTSGLFGRRVRGAFAYWKIQSTETRHPGTAGSAAAMSPRRYVCSGSGLFRRYTSMRSSRGSTSHTT